MALPQVEEVYNLRRQLGLCGVCGSQVRRTRCFKGPDICERGHKVPR